MHKTTTHLFALFITIYNPKPNSTPNRPGLTYCSASVLRRNNFGSNSVNLISKLHIFKAVDTPFNIFQTHQTNTNDVISHLITCDVTMFIYRIPLDICIYYILQLMKPVTVNLNAGLNF